MYKVMVTPGYTHKYDLDSGLVNEVESRIHFKYRSGELTERDKVMAHVGRLAGAILLETNDQFFSLGTLKNRVSLKMRVRQSAERDVLGRRVFLSEK